MYEKAIKIYEEPVYKQGRWDLCGELARARFMGRVEIPYKKGKISKAFCEIKEVESILEEGIKRTENSEFKKLLGFVVLWKSIRYKEIN